MQSCKTNTAQVPVLPQVATLGEANYIPPRLYSFSMVTCLTPVQRMGKRKEMEIGQEPS